MSTGLPSGTLLLDYIRYHQNLMGTKIGCREGDCGACTVLIGDLKNGELEYQSATSCLTALGNINGKHIVTVEGTNGRSLNPIQEAMADEGATQCGFCTPGFVVSLAGFCLKKGEVNEENALAAINGNICRCTGYKSIERASATVCKVLEDRGEQNPISYAIQKELVPAWFADIKERLVALRQNQNGALSPASQKPKVLGGGTDLYVQQHETMIHADIEFLFNRPEFRGITQVGSRCEMGAAATVTDMLESPVFQAHFPNLKAFVKLISSTPIRNIATVAGNLVNASPIGDLSIFFLSLDAVLTLSDGRNSRQLPLREFYLGYKKLNKTEEERVQKISFELPNGQTKINFEKVCKRTHLDIATVNTALVVKRNGNTIFSAGLSAGGLGPVPLFFPKSSAWLAGKEVSESVLNTLLEIAQTEISPISDVRGTEAYKRLLLSQLIKAHFSVLFKDEVAFSFVD